MDSLFFSFSKIFWLIFAPANLIVWLALAAWLCMKFGRPRLGGGLFTSLILGLLIIAYLPLGDWLIHPLERRFDNGQQLTSAPTGILVLGGNFSLSLSERYQRPQLIGSVDRLTEFVELASRWPEAQLLFSGGSGSLTEQGYKEADAARQLLQQIGRTDLDVGFEDQSRNTYENAVNSLALVGPQAQGEWVLITSAYHMPRAYGAFCRLGWKLQTYPVDFRTAPEAPPLYQLDFAGNLSQLNMAMREWIGLLAYRITGKTNRLLPAPDDEC